MHSEFENVLNIIILQANSKNLPIQFILQYGTLNLKNALRDNNYILITI